MKALIKLWMVILFIPFLSSCYIKNLNLLEGKENFRAQNYRTAFIRLKPEAEKGNPDAQYAVGYMYYYGEGVVENRDQAWFWIHMAARQGQPDAVEAVRILGPAPPVR